MFPANSRSSTGNVGSQTSPLDVPLTVVEKDVNGLEALNAICDAIKATTGTTILMGMIDPNAFWHTTLSISSDKESGRTLLTQLLRATGPSLSWRLLRGAGSEPSYFLNIHQVQW